VRAVLGVAGSRLKFRRKVVSTAIVFFKRICIRFERCCGSSYVCGSAVVHMLSVGCRHRMLDLNPWLLCATVLYLASKVEESFTKVQEILSAIHPKSGGGMLPRAACVDSSACVRLLGATIGEPLSEKLVLECEFYVLESLNFELVVFHPYRPLQQYVMVNSVMLMLRALYCEVLRDRAQVFA
jgi:hypothetical protein